MQIKPASQGQLLFLKAAAWKKILPLEVWLQAPPSSTRARREREEELGWLGALGLKKQENKGFPWARFKPTTFGLQVLCFSLAPLGFSYLLEFGGSTYRWRESWQVGRRKSSESTSTPVGTDWIHRFMMTLLSVTLTLFEFKDWKNILRGSCGLGTQNLLCVSHWFLGLATVAHGRACGNVIF